MHQHGFVAVAQIHIQIRSSDSDAETSIELYWNWIQIFALWMFPFGLPIDRLWLFDVLFFVIVTKQLGTGTGNHQPKCQILLSFFSVALSVYLWCLSFVPIASEVRVTGLYLFYDNFYISLLFDANHFLISLFSLSFFVRFDPDIIWGFPELSALICSFPFWRESYWKFLIIQSTVKNTEQKRHSNSFVRCYAISVNAINYPRIKMEAQTDNRLFTSFKL